MGSIFWGLQKIAQSLKIWSIHWLIIIVPSADSHFEGYTPFYTPKMSYQVSYYYYYHHYCCYYYYYYYYIYICVSQDPIQISPFLGDFRISQHF